MSSETEIGAPRLPSYVRFRDLRNAGIVDNWEQLRNLVADYHFPPGMLLSPNTRVWDIKDVRAWLASRPSDCGAIVWLHAALKRAERSDTPGTRQERRGTEGEFGRINSKTSKP